MNIAVLIPSLDPNERLGTLVSALRQRGVTQLVVIDDGSAARTQPIFDLCASLGCIVVHHDRNRGKGEALRTGLRAAREHFPNLAGVVTADGDGQHRVNDILRVAHALETTASGLILGTRDFSGSHVPFRSRFGNRFSSLFFRLSAGVSCPDTQTGLRGIPAALFDFALSVSGSRYEYEMNLLFSAAQQHIPLRYIPIETVYEDNNSVSHFRPLRDSARIYAAPLRFAIASLSSFFIDILLFSLFALLLPSRTAPGDFNRNLWRTGMFRRIQLSAQPALELFQHPRFLARAGNPVSDSVSVSNVGERQRCLAAVLPAAPVDVD